MCVCVCSVCVCSVCVCLCVQSSHLALIDTLMMAYTVEMVSVERVVACVSRLGPAHSDLGPAHSDQHLDELPYDTEDAIPTWINQVLSVCLPP